MHVRVFFMGLPPTPRPLTLPSLNVSPSPPLSPFFRWSSGGQKPLRTHRRPGPVPPLILISVHLPHEFGEFFPVTQAPLNGCAPGRGQNLYPITTAFIFMTGRRSAQEAGGKLGLSYSQLLCHPFRQQLWQFSGSSFASFAKTTCPVNPPSTHSDW